MSLVLNLNMREFCVICYHSYNLKIVKSTHGGVIFSSYRLKSATLLKVSLLHECFSGTTFVKNVKNTHIFAQCEQFEMPLKVGSYK